jgi:hypothetical protein
MLITRLAKILISLSLALFCLLVAFDNVTDPHSNYEFVTHVLSMDTTFPGNTLMYRSGDQSDPLADRLCPDHCHPVRVRCAVLRRRLAHVADTKRRGR